MTLKIALPAGLMGGLLLAGCVGGPYVRHAVKTPLPPMEAWQDFQGDLAQMETALQAVKAKAEKCAFLASLSENIRLVVDGKAAFTVALDHGKITLERGIAAGAEPTLIIPVTLAHIQNLDKALEDGALDDQELFNIANVVFVPCIRRMFAMPYLFGRDISAGKLHDFMQFRIKNPAGLTYHGAKAQIDATLLNVDGMFLAFPGLQGDPEARLDLTVAEAQELYQLAVYDYYRDKDDDAKLKANIKRYIAMIEAATAYRRAGR